MSTRQHKTIEMLEQKKTNSKTPVGPTKARAPSTNQHYPNVVYSKRKELSLWNNVVV